jgi:hypothetical protein
MTQKSKEQLEAEQRAKVIVSAYRHVFGVDGHRSEAQQVVWDDMKKRARLEAPVFITDVQGALCPLRAAFADGQRSNFLQTQAIVNARAEQTEKQEPEVKR